MRTGKENEYIVTEFVTPTTQNAYILVAIQSCKFKLDEMIEGDEEEAKEWLILIQMMVWIMILVHCVTDALSAATDLRLSDSLFACLCMDHNPTKLFKNAHSNQTVFSFYQTSINI